MHFALFAFVEKRRGFFRRKLEQMHGFIRNLLTEWRKLNLPFDDETFVAAVSGGADSVSLLLALKELRDRKKLNLRFVIAHFNHNLRGAESEHWTEQAVTRPYSDNSRGLGLAEMMQAFTSGHPHRASVDLALHVLETMHAILGSNDRGERVKLETSVTQPELLPLSVAF